MATGDTVGGQVRVRAERTDGSEPRLLGPLPQSVVDIVNANPDADDKLYVNTAVSKSVSKPSGARSITEPRLVFDAGEVVKLEFQTNSGSQALDHDKSDAFQIDASVLDRNRGERFPRTLTASDSGLSANPTADASSWTEFFTYTVPDRQRVNLAGLFGATAIEP